MPNFNKIVKVTQEQMQTLINGGSINGELLADDTLYAVKKENFSNEEIASLAKSIEGSNGIETTFENNKIKISGMPASSSQFGMVKVYTDSSGYLCIDTY